MGTLRVSQCLKHICYLIGYCSQVKSQVCLQGILVSLVISFFAFRKLFVCLCV